MNLICERFQSFWSIKVGIVLFGLGECISEVVMNKTKFRQNSKSGNLENPKSRNMQIQGRGGCNDYSNTGMLWLKIYKDPWCTLFLVLKSLHFKVISIKHLLFNSPRNKMLSQVHRSRIKMGGTKKRSNSLLDKVRHLIFYLFVWWWWESSTTKTLEWISRILPASSLMAAHAATLQPAASCILKIRCVNTFISF